jgi:cytochrome c oxidase subunit 6a
MNAQRLGLRLGRTLRSPNVRTTVQRRFESSADKLPLPGKKLVGPQDNAFNRERAAVKAHAAATSSMSRTQVVREIFQLIGLIGLWRRLSL